MSTLSPTAWVTVTDPDNPLGMPAYDGPAHAASAALASGTYAATDDAGEPVRLSVYGGWVYATYRVAVSA